MTRLYDGGDVGLRRVSDCSACAGTCLWKRLDGEQLRIHAPAAGLAPGDRVEVRVPAAYALAAALIAYGLPLAGLLGGAAAAALGVDRSDLAVFIGAVTGGTAAYALTGTFRRHIERRVLARFEVRRASGGEC